MSSRQPAAGPEQARPDVSDHTIRRAGWVAIGR
jgi:hypothetical protein